MILRKIKMNAILPIPNTSSAEPSWVIQIPSDMARIMGVEAGSLGVLHPKSGGAEVEILPPTPPELKAEALETYEELKEYFAEMKRLGD
jgi:hypothetical protein